MIPTYYPSSPKNISDSVPKSITSREREVLHLIAYENSSKEIAQKLYVSPETINSHRKNIMSKLGVRNSAGMIRAAYEYGILSLVSVANIPTNSQY